ncbi:unnamed protein product, partial [Prorocentrum cordatum]
MRCLFGEVMAGNYMVRNTAFARAFLRRWAWYNTVMPRGGFSSSDNGAIHLLVMETVQVEGYDRCFNLYRKLDRGVNDLSKYWEFVKCTHGAIGPPRAWQMKSGSLIVWPRLQFFVVDGMFVNKLASDDIGPVMHHGIKDAKDVTTHYWKDLRSCSLNAANVTVSASDLGQEFLKLARNYPEHYRQGNGCRQCADAASPHSRARPWRTRRRTSSWACRGGPARAPPRCRRRCRTAVRARGATLHLGAAAAGRLGAGPQFPRSFHGATGATRAAGAALRAAAPRCRLCGAMSALRRRPRFWGG